LLFVRRPWLVAHLHTLGNEPGTLPNIKRRIKRAVIGFSYQVIACSYAMAREINKNVTVIPNPYRDSEFHHLDEKSRTHDLVFLGRLVSDKGVPLLIEAMAQLRERGIAPSLVIIGSGPDEDSLRSLCEKRSLMGAVRFTGHIARDAVVDLLNRCRVMVIPSIVDEGFGIVAIEGIACGCIVVAAHLGGLPEAVGPCGVTFSKGDVSALADCLAGLLADEVRIAALRTKAVSHLEHHRPSVVADAYLSKFAQARDTSMKV
jgi:glycogen(starch) synthase